MLKDRPIADDPTLLPRGESNSPFAFDSLQSLRKKLLDLTSRNALLNYRHPTATSVRLVDELPDQIYGELGAERALTLVPVPEPTEQQLVAAGYLQVDPDSGEKTELTYPTATQWAAHLGLDTSYELPQPASAGAQQPQHQDRHLQTLLYAAPLDAKLRGMRSKAQTALEESGANVLYLGIGFLEWFESPESDLTRWAPLFTMPVTLERTRSPRDQGAYRYSLRLRDDALLTNVTLREKLDQDFGLLLPDVGEDMAPEDYFRAVEEALLPHQPRWRVRRMATLMLLNFTKQAMYQDLDPANWPSDARIEEHPLIARFFTAGEQDGGGYRDEHTIDAIEGIHERYPLIYDADSSQHSALIDAVQGRNLVIEGPPGSGKSQTITNLIAASIANGKKVLFVAEKMAALNVVKDRLDKAGLGDLCLELHSHKTSKQKVLGDLGRGIALRDRASQPAQIKADIGRYEDLRTRLQCYVDLINRDWMNTGQSLHSILNKATRYREESNIDPELLAIDGVSGSSFDDVSRKRLLDDARMLASIYRDVSRQAPDGDIARHYWYGVRKQDLVGSQVQALREGLEGWNAALGRLHGQWRAIADGMGLAGDEAAVLEDLKAMAEVTRRLPEYRDDWYFPLLPPLLARGEEFAELLACYREIHDAHEVLMAVMPAAAIDDAAVPPLLEATLENIRNLGPKPSATLASLREAAVRCEEAVHAFDDVAAQFAQIAPNLPPALGGCLESSLPGVLEAQALCRLVMALPDELWRYRDAVYDDPNLDALLQSTQRILTDLRPLHAELSVPFDLEVLPASRELRDLHAVVGAGGAFKWLSAAWRTARRQLIALSTAVKPDKKAVLAAIPKLIQYAALREDLEQLHRLEPVLKREYQGVHTPIERLRDLRLWYKAVREEYGIGFGPRVAIGDALLGMDRSIALALADLGRRRLFGRLAQFRGTWLDLQHRFQGCAALQDEGATAPAEVLDGLGQVLRRELQQLDGLISDHGLTLQRLAGTADELAAQHRRIARWRALPLVARWVPDPLPLATTAGAFSGPVYAAAEQTLAIAHQLADSALLCRAFEARPDARQYRSALALGSELERGLQECDREAEVFSARGDVILARWIESSGGQVSCLMERNRAALANPEWLDTWLDYVRVRSRIAAQGLTRISDALADRAIQPEGVEAVVKAVIYHQLAREALATDAELAQFSGMEQMAIRERFQDYDKKLLQLQRELIAYRGSRATLPGGICSGKVGDFTEMGLIRHNLTLKKPRIAVRTLLSRAGGAVQALKPCFMMSPMSVAQYLEPGRFDFDLVVMDEASQIRPEDALGAIARGRSLVVVGDPKQLPPTSFFQKTIDGDEGDGNAVALQSTESILETVMPMFSTRRLRWHYRSRHESLIAFSNQHFYDSNLVLFPSPLQQSEEFGIRFHRVAQGRFHDGRNPEEVRQLVVAVARQLLERPDESVGIVAMNARQSEEIERQLEQYVKEDPLLQAAYEASQLSDEPLFVKNLENVQGDERDVIVISMTYGPATAGAAAMPQRFGPINADAGWRRLNVLFTRAKKRMHVHSSMDSSHIRTTEGSAGGVLALKNFLAYCETGRVQQYQHTGRPAGSDFEIAVMRRLQAHGYECEPQLGVAGYYLDLAVRDPGRPGRFLMGIECDGATYHSAKSARDRDRLRQEVLENLGWCIRRIWSTDWFKHPDAQLAPILRELESLRTPVEVESAAARAGLADAAPEPAPATGPAPGAQGGLFDELAGGDLRGLLIDFDRRVIRPALPDTPDEERLLRPAMLDKLLLHMPCSKAEFLEVIPSYLHEATAAAEGRFLERVLELIDRFG